MLLPSPKIDTKSVLKSVRFLKKMKLFFAKTRIYNILRSIQVGTFIAHKYVRS